eukprot:8266669-Pyramimonas_sp.AAC.1
MTASHARASIPNPTGVSGAGNPSHFAPGNPTSASASPALALALMQVSFGALLVLPNIRSDRSDRSDGSDNNGSDNSSDELVITLEQSGSGNITVRSARRNAARPAEHARGDVGYAYCGPRGARTFGSDTGTFAPPVGELYPPVGELY